MANLPPWAQQYQTFKSGKFEPTTLPQQEEQQFQNWLISTPWYKEIKQREGADLNDQQFTQQLFNNADYDYRGAYKAGVATSRDPHDNMIHWPDAGPDGKMLKAPFHPTAWMQFFQQSTGKNPEDLGINTYEDAVKWSQQNMPTLPIIQNNSPLEGMYPATGLAPQAGGPAMPQTMGNFAIPPEFAQSMQPMPQGVPIPGPPASEEEFMQRKSGWQNFMEKLSSDPSLQRMLMFAGTAMMNPAAPGQGVGGHIASSLLRGIDYASAVGSAERKQRLEEGKLAADIAESQGRLDVANRQVDVQERAQESEDKRWDSKLNLERDELEFRKDANRTEMDLKGRALDVDSKRLGIAMAQLNLDREYKMGELAQANNELKLDRKEMEARAAASEAQNQRALLAIQQKLDPSKTIETEGKASEGGLIFRQGGRIVSRYQTDLLGENGTITEYGEDGKPVRSYSADSAPAGANVKDGVPNPLDDSTNKLKPTEQPMSTPDELYKEALTRYNLDPKDPAQETQRSKIKARIQQIFPDWDIN